MNIKMVDKAEKIRASLRATREKRARQSCRVFVLKIDASHLSHLKEEYLQRLFLEKKWYRNFIIAIAAIFNFDYKTKVVTVKKQDIFEERDITYLSSQMRQSIISELQDNVKSLEWDDALFAGL
jgi:hypothetical protein